MSVNMFSLRKVLSALLSRPSSHSRHTRLGCEQFGERVNPVLTTFSGAGASGLFDYDDYQVDEGQSSQSLALSPFQFSCMAGNYTSADATATMSYGSIVGFHATCTKTGGGGPTLDITLTGGTFTVINADTGQPAAQPTNDVVLTANMVTLPYTKATVNVAYQVEYAIWSGQNVIGNFTITVNPGGTAENLRDSILTQLQDAGLTAKASGTNAIVLLGKAGNPLTDVRIKNYNAAGTELNNNITAPLATQIAPGVQYHVNNNLVASGQ